MDENDYRRDGMARHYEPPSFLVMMEILKQLAQHGSVTLTITIRADETEPAEL